MIIFENVSKEFKDKTVLENVNIHILKGEVCGIVGRNGSGKSVFMKLAAGMLYPTEGQIEVNGKVLERGDFPQDTGIILDNTGFLKELTGYKNLKILASVLKRVSDEKIAAVMELVGLEAGNKTSVGKYSVGMKQKLLLAQAIMEEPELLLLDEPFNGLDEESEQKMMGLLRKMNQDKGVTIVIVSHDMEGIRSLCHKVYRVHKKGIFEESV